MAGVCLARKGLAYGTIGVCSDCAYVVLKRVGLLGMALIGGGFTLFFMTPVVPLVLVAEIDSFALLGLLSLDDVDDRAGDATEVAALLAPAEALLLLDEDDDDDGTRLVSAPPPPPVSRSDELRFTGLQSFEKLEQLSVLIGDEAPERFEMGDEERFETGDADEMVAERKLAVSLARLILLIGTLASGKLVEPLSELSVQVPSDEIDSLSISVLIRFLDRCCCWLVLNDKSVGSIEAK